MPDHYLMTFHTYIVHYQTQAPSQDSLENQSWFHNDITRQETAELLQCKGQFLIRKTIDSKRRTAVLVLSVNAGRVGIKHFVMQLNEKGQFRLEGVWFNSIQQLLNYHIDTGLLLQSYYFTNHFILRITIHVVRLGTMKTTIQPLLHIQLYDRNFLFHQQGGIT